MSATIMMYVVVKMYTDNLTDEELAVLGTTAFTYQDPRNKLFDFKSFVYQRIVITCFPVKYRDIISTSCIEF